MGVCCMCYQEDYTYTFDGGEFCRQCLLDTITQPDVIEEKLPEFVEYHKKDFVDWITDTKAGDCYGIGDFVEEAKRMAVESWKEHHPDEYKEAMKDFRTSCPGEWEDFLKNLKRSA